MAAWDGIYELTAMDNIKPFLNSLGLPDADVQRLSAFKFNAQMSRNGNDFTLKQFTADKEIMVSFTIGKEFEFTSIEGIPLKGTVTMPNDRVLHGKFEEGLEEVAELHNDGNIIDTFSIKGVQYKRTFTRK